MNGPAEPQHMDFIVAWLAWGHNQYPFIGQLLLVMMLDVITGLIAAFITKTLSSSVGYNGVGRKVIMLMAVAMGVILEPFANGIPLGKLVAVFYTLTEGLSILENMSRSGVPIPAVLADALEKIRSNNKKATETKLSIHTVRDGSGNSEGHVDETIAVVTKTEKATP